MAPPDAAEFHEILSSYREALGLEICVKFFRAELLAETSLPYINRQFTAHLTPFCLRVKRTQDARCRQCDLCDIPARCAIDRGIRLNTCHAGATEIIVPVFMEGSLAVVLYLGQFRRQGGPASLPSLSPSRIAHSRRLAAVLQGYFELLLRSPRAPGPPSSRLGEIESFIASRLRENVSLSDVSDHMNLSVSRCGHLIRESSGSSFVKLRDRLRLARARDLLASTLHKVAFVASECGFPSPQPFYRFFRKATGLTPTGFRAKYRAEA